MTPSTLVVRDSHLETLQSQTSEPSFSTNYKTLKKWCKSGKILRHFRAYNRVVFHLDNSPLYRRAFLFGMVCYFLSKGSAILKYTDQNTVTVSLSFLFKRGLIALRDLFKKPFFLISLKDHITTLRKNHVSTYPLPAAGPPYYFRTDFHFGLLAGGSVGHIAGVLNNLEELVGTPPIFITSDPIPTVDKTIQSYKVSPSDKFLDYNEYPNLAFSQTYEKQASTILKNHPPRFLYERYSCGSLSGVQLSQKFQVPLVLEYNGSEVWIGKNWGSPFKHEKLFLDIEILNLQAAQLIVVVSQVMKDSLTHRGIASEKVLVNPNGVNPEVYSPDIDGSVIRKKIKCQEKLIIGFIGTFGKWHGAEVLAQSFATLLKKYPLYRETLHLMMIGEGLTLPPVKETIKQNQLEKFVTFTGTIPQEKAPPYLAACDILVSPHVPNSDGSKFFGSPTKLFEYMAMGKGIIASDLEQIGDILDHKKTAYLVKPGDESDLIQGLKTLIDHPDLRKTLGQNARKEVTKNYTWKKHTHNIIERLKEICPPA